MLMNTHRNRLALMVAVAFVSATVFYLVIPQLMVPGQCLSLSPRNSSTFVKSSRLPTTDERNNTVDRPLSNPRVEGSLFQRLEAM